MINSSHIKIIIVFIFLAALSVALYLRRPKDIGESNWDKGYLGTAETTYYASHINAIVEKWRKAGKNLQGQSDSQPDDYLKTLLVIDLDKKAIWIEENGQISEDDYMEFPQGVNFTLDHYSTTQITHLQKDWIILKYVDSNTALKSPEQLFLQGFGIKDSFGINIIDTLTLAKAQGLSVNPPVRNVASTNGDDLVSPFLVTKANYQKYIDSLADSRIIQTEKKIELAQNISITEKNKALWKRIEKYLYIEIERQIRKAGYELVSIQVIPEPDFAAGYSTFGYYRNNIIHKIFGGSISTLNSYLIIDYIGNDIWYVRSSIGPEDPVRSSNKYEFLVSLPNKKIESAQRKKLLQKGRKIQQPGNIPESKWKTTLTNDMKIEFLGICENPSAGKQWCGPDGTPVDYVPYFNATHYVKLNNESKIYEFVWRITGSSKINCTGFSAEGSNGSYHHVFDNRYGNSLKGDINAEAFGFDKSIVKTALKFTIKQNTFERTVLFKNISLVPGQDQGFEIEVLETEE